MNAKASAEGVDVYFMNDPRFGINLKVYLFFWIPKLSCSITIDQDGNGVRALFDTVRPDGIYYISIQLVLNRDPHCMILGETPTGKRLHDLFNKYIPLIENKLHQHRPITIVVITDGVPSAF